MANDLPPFLRAMLGEWQSIASGLGQQPGASGGSASEAGAATGEVPPWNAGMQAMAARALAAANVPTRDDLEALSARIGRIEAALFRIEALLTETRASPPVDPAD